MTFASDYQSINLLDVIVSHMNVFNSVVTCYMRSSHIYSILSMLFWYTSLIFLNTVLSFPCIRARVYVHTYICTYERQVKGNYKGKHSDLICRWCKNATETQQHILKKCPMFQDITRNTPYDTYFNDEEEATNTVKDIIQKVKTKLSNPP